MALKTDLLGAVLGGGRSTRMGTDKGEVNVGGRTMLQRVGEALTTIADHTVLLGPDRDGWECWPDSVHAEGPLAGIATALTRMEETHAMVVAVDHPFTRPETLDALVRLLSGVPVVPVDRDGVRQVTCAVYPAAVAVYTVEEALAGGSIQSFLDRVSFRPVTHEEWEDWGEDGRSWYSVDTPERVEEGIRLFGP